jgi:hypothetical protein
MPTVKIKVVVPPMTRQLLVMEKERGHRSHRGLGDHRDPISGSQGLLGTRALLQIHRVELTIIASIKMRKQSTFGVA